MSPVTLTLTPHPLLLTAFEFVAEVTRQTHALLEYKVHNLSLTSDSQQDLQLDPYSIPSIHVKPRHSYRFCLYSHYTILWVDLFILQHIWPVPGTYNFLRMINFSLLLMITVATSWFTLIHNKTSTLQSNVLHENTYIRTRLGKLGYSPMMRWSGHLLSVKLYR